MNIPLKLVIPMVIASFLCGAGLVWFFLSDSGESSLQSVEQQLQVSDSALVTLQKDITRLRDTLHYYQTEMDMFDQYLVATKSRNALQSAAFYRKRDSLRALLNMPKETKP